MIATGNYCPSCIGFFKDENISHNDLKELTSLGAIVYCPNGCIDDYNSLERQLLLDSDELEIATPEMKTLFNKKYNELELLVARVNDISEQLEPLSFEYKHNPLHIKDLNTGE